MELVTLRVRVTAAGTKPELQRQERVGPDPADADLDPRPVDLDGERTAALYALEGLRAGMRIGGPALLVGQDTTVLLPGSHTATVDDYGNVVLCRRG